MRGYFGIGVEGISKPMNVGNLFRSAHAFGASFVFTVGPILGRSSAKSDTSLSDVNVPYFAFPDLGALRLPRGCALVGVELLDEAVELPVFRHPRCAAYVLGRERGSLSAELVARCDHMVKIPTKFCINLATAGVVVLYDRLISLGRFPGRPLVPGGDPVPLPDHVFGASRRRLPLT
ncbi:MAG: RNA methyltransferase [Alphaproteobacteria bacterium]|nr:RNA methyltransferase [Alphaproteobacteria bacterium]